MAQKIPQYATRKIAPAPIPGVRFPVGMPPNAFGTQLGTAFNILGRAVTERAVQHGAEDNNRKVQIALADAMTQSHEVMAELETRTGEDALPGTGIGGVPTNGVYQDAETQIFRIGDSASRRLANDRQRELFEAEWASFAQTQLGRASHHEAQQRRVSAIQAEDAKIELEKRVAKYNWNQPAAVMASRDRLTTTILQNSRGLPLEAVQNRLEQEQEALSREVLNGQLSAMLRIDPEQTWHDLLAGEYEDILPPAEIERWIDRARVISHRNAQAEAAAVASQEKQAREAEKVAALQAERELIDLSITPGALTLEAVRARADALSSKPRVYEAFLLQAVGRGPVHVDQKRFADLLAAAHRGEDVQDGLSTALGEQLITVGHYNQIREASENRRFETAEQYITDILYPREPVDDAFAPQRYGEAMLSWRLWRADNEDASPSQALKEAKLIVHDHLLFAVKEVLVGKALPRHAVVPSGTAHRNMRLNLDIEATRAATLAAFLEQHGIPETDVLLPSTQATLEADALWLEQTELIDLYERQYWRLQSAAEEGAGPQ